MEATVISRCEEDSREPICIVLSPIRWNALTPRPVRAVWATPAMEEMSLYD